MNAGKNSRPDSAGAPGPIGICADIFNYWRNLTGEDQASVPTRDRVDLLTLPKSVRENFFLIERRGDRYLVRLASTRLIDSMGGETTGKYLDELMRPEIYPTRRTLFDTCVRMTAPVYYGATLAAPTRDHVAFRRMLLPLRSDAEAPVDLVCGAMDFVPMEDLRTDSNAKPTSDLFPKKRTKGLFFQHIFRNGRWQLLSGATA